MKARVNNRRYGYTAALALSLGVFGVFSVDGSVYAGFVPTYITVPAALVLSSLPALAVQAVLSRHKTAQNEKLFSSIFPKINSMFFALILSAALILSSAKPLSVFTEVLHKLVFDGVDVKLILAFVFPVVAYIAYKGADCASNTAIILALPLLLSLVLSIALSAESFDISRLYPFPGASLEDSARHILSSSASFIPVMAGTVIISSGSDSSGQASVSRALLIALPATAVSLLSIRLVYPAPLLVDMTMPLYRIGFLDPWPSYLLRLDKPFIMLWLIGCLTATAFCAAVSSHALSATVGSSSKKYPAVIITILIFLLALIEKNGGERISTVMHTAHCYLGIASLIPLILMIIPVTIRSRRRPS